MSDKPLAGLVTAIAIAPLCIFCVLGPAAVIAAGGWALASLGDFAIPLIASSLAVGGWFVWRAIQRGSAEREALKQTQPDLRSRELSGNIE